jgi:hypothetical protein
MHGAREVGGIDRIANLALEHAWGGGSWENDTVRSNKPGKGQPWFWGESNIEGGPQRRQRHKRHKG